jgi:hypothetical protein
MLTGIIGEIDVKIEKIHRLIIAASRADDPELAVGGATTEDMSNVQRKLDAAAAACESVDANIREVLRGL